MDGVADVKVNLLTRKGSVTYTDDSKVTPDDVIKAITGIGFGATLAEEGVQKLEKVNYKPQLYRMINDGQHDGQPFLRMAYVTGVGRTCIGNCCSVRSGPRVL